MKNIYLSLALMLPVFFANAKDEIKDQVVVFYEGKTSCKVNVARNAKLDDGELSKKSFLLKLGGINDEYGGYIHIKLPENLGEFNADVIEIELKGDKENSFAPVLLTGNDAKIYYCWNGIRSSWDARMPVFKNEWRKYKFYAKDFVAQQAPDKKLNNFNESTWLKIAIGSTARVYKKTTAVMISSIMFKNSKIK